MSDKNATIIQGQSINKMKDLDEYYLYMMFDRMRGQEIKLDLGWIESMITNTTRNSFHVK